VSKKPEPQFKVGDGVRHRTFDHFGVGTVAEVEWTTAANGYYHYRVDWRRWGSYHIWWAESELTKEGVK
jgi:heat shock protein HspQ